MIVIDSPRILKASALTLPYQHWTHLSLDNQEKIFLCLLPHQIAEDGSFVADTLPEIVVSPIDFERWQYVYRLSGYLRDRPGLLADLGRVIKNFRLNILCSESAVTEHLRFHYFEMLIDIGAIASHSGLNNLISQFEWSLQAELLDDLAFSQTNNQEKPRIKFKPVFTLHQAKKAYDLLKANPYFDTELPPVADAAEVEKEVHCDASHSESPLLLKILLPKAIREQFNSIGKKLFYQAISDTKDRYLRILFFKEEAAVLHATIKHKEKIGAFACIAKQLAASNFNIIASRSELSAPNENASLHITIQSTDDTEIRSDELKSRLLRAFDREECEMYAPISIGFPHGINPATNFDLILNEPKKTNKKPTPSAASLPATSMLREKLEQRFETLEKQMQKTGLNEAERRFLNLCINMRRQHSAWTGKSLKKTLFLSTHFSNKERLETIKKIASESEFGFEVVTGEQLEMFSDKTAGLIERVKSSTHFLGVWPADKGAKDGGSYTPSPWLLWELGVANSNKLHWRLLIDNRIEKDYWARIDSHQQHILYSESDFESGLRRALRSLASYTPNISQGENWLAPPACPLSCA